MAVEIYPRRFTGPVVKSRVADRVEAWDALGVAGDDRLAALAVSSEDAFDAAVSAVAMARSLHDDGRSFPPGADRVVRREGWIWGVPLEW